MQTQIDKRPPADPAARGLAKAFIRMANALAEAKAEEDREYAQGIAEFIWAAQRGRG